MTTTRKTYLCEIETCTRPVQARSLCGPHYGTWHRRQKRYRITCQGCGTEAMVGTKTRRYCTANCLRRANGMARQREAINRRLPMPYTGKPTPSARHQRAAAKATLAAIGTVAAKTWTAGPCAICQQPFLTRSWGANTARCCSEECDERNFRRAKRIGRERRRALKCAAFVANVSPLKVHERDNWKCHLCGRKVRRRAVVPHPLAPTIDHIIPLAKGGTHEPANCATAHYRCNAAKGDRGAGEQLALIG